MENCYRDIDSVTPLIYIIITILCESYLHVFLKALHGDAVGPLGVADNSLSAVRKSFRVRCEKYQVRYRQYCSHHPDAGSYHERRFPAKSWPKWVYYGYVPITRIKYIIIIVCRS